MKRIGNLIPQIAEIDNLYLAYHKASIGKQATQPVLDYSHNLQHNIKTLQNQIITGDVEVGNYRYFTIRDPKKRQICAASFPERILHHAIMNICHPIFERTLIDDTYATRLKKGTYAAIARARFALRNYKFVAKLDVRKYFDSINHTVLKTKLQRLFKDYQLLAIFDSIIDSYSVTPDCGIPIGNLTSQYFANLYLSEADHFAKKQLAIPIIIRYMDDILLFEHVEALLKGKIIAFDRHLKDNLKLTLKPVIINPCEKGVLYLGYRLYPHKILLNGRSKKRFKAKLTAYQKKLENNEWTQSKYREHLIPLLSFVSHAYSKRFRTQLLKSGTIW